jgi:hypothetical protein
MSEWASHPSDMLQVLHEGSREGATPVTASIMCKANDMGNIGSPILKVTTESPWMGTIQILHCYNIGPGVYVAYQVRWDTAGTNKIYGTLLAYHEDI